MNIAIEFGGSEFRSLRREAGRLLARRVSTEYLVIPGSDPRRKLLESRVEELAHCDDGLLLFGPAAEELSVLLGIPMQSALQNGRLREADPVSRQFLSTLVDGLLPAAETSGSNSISSNSASSDSVNCIVVASPTTESLELDEQDGLSFLVQLVRLRGYEPQLITPGLALVLAECSDTCYSGITVKLGATQVNVSVVHQTRELLRLCLPRGGHSLDQQLAKDQESYLRLHDGRQVLDTRPLRDWRQGLSSLNQVLDDKTLALRNQYRELCLLVLHRLYQELTPNIVRQLPRQMPVVLGGPLSVPAGVETLFQQCLQNVSLPVNISSIRKVRDVVYSALKGGLLVGDSFEVVTPSSAA